MHTIRHLAIGSRDVELVLARMGCRDDDWDLSSIMADAQVSRSRRSARPPRRRSRLYHHPPDCYLDLFSLHTSPGHGWLAYDPRATAHGLSVPDSFTTIVGYRHRCILYSAAGRICGRRRRRFMTWGRWACLTPDTDARHHGKPPKAAGDNYRKERGDRQQS